MVLRVGSELKSGPITLTELYTSHPELYDSAKRFARIPPRNIEPAGVMYIRQKEDIVSFAGDSFDNGNKIVHLGTQDVLTCHVLILHHTATRVTALAHYDEYVRERRIENLVKNFCQKVTERTYWYDDDIDSDSDDWEWDDTFSDDSDEIQLTDEELKDVIGSIELKLVGGYDEVSGKGSVLSKRILSFFSSHELTFNLSLCCLGPANTRGRGHTVPIVGGVAVDVSSSKTVPATFNRTFVDSLPEETIMTLMLGPSLIKKPFKLREIILAKEDEGFSKTRSTS